MARRGHGRYTVGWAGRAAAVLGLRERASAEQKPQLGFATASPALSVLLLQGIFKRDWDPLPPPPLSQAAPDSHTARTRAQHGSSSTLEVGIAPQPGEVGRSRCAWQ